MSTSTKRALAIFLSISSITMATLACGETVSSTRAPVTSIATVAATQSKPTTTKQATGTPAVTVPLTNTPKVTELPQATPTVKPTDIPKPTPTAETIVDVPGILGKSVAEIEKSLGKSEEILSMRVGDAEELPDGGESRTYHRGQYSFYLFFDRNGIAKGFQLIEGLGESNRLDQWGILLTRFGFSVSKFPDVEAPAARRWNNFNGYKIVIFASKINGPVWSVQIWKIR